jgi:hypothetical protein
MKIGGVQLVLVLAFVASASQYGQWGGQILGQGQISQGQFGQGQFGQGQFGQGQFIQGQSGQIGQLLQGQGQALSQRIGLRVGRQALINFATGGYNQQRQLGYLQSNPSYQCRYKFKNPFSFLQPYGSSGLKGFIPSNGFSSSLLGVQYRSYLLKQMQQMSRPVEDLFFSGRD